MAVLLTDRETAELAAPVRRTERRSFMIACGDAAGGAQQPQPLSCRRRLVPASSEAGAINLPAFVACLVVAGST